ncbi:MAG: hypothetical protein NC433_09315 [Clostridiales bacterium]|nr:hypothetical protein [Clostridiales bacterium]
MKIVGIILAVFYAGLMIFAVCNEKSKSISSILIFIGGILIGIYSLIDIVWCRNLIIFLIIGMISISIGTLINGYRQNNIHIHHHIIRLIIEAIITIICWISK